MTEPNSSVVVTVFKNKNCPLIITPLVASIIGVKIHISDIEAPSVEPYIVVPGSGSIFSDIFIAKYISRLSAATLTCDGNSINSTQVDQWLSISQRVQSDNKLGELLNQHLSTCTYVVGHDLTIADIVLYVRLQSFDKEVFPHLDRWLSLIQSKLPAISADPAPKISKADTKKGKDKAREPGSAPETGARKKDKDSNKEKVVPKEKGSASGKDAKADNQAAEDGGLCPPLEGAEEGKVCKYCCPYR